MEHLLNDNSILIRRNNLNLRIMGHIPKESFNYIRHYNRLKREYLFNNQLQLNSALYYNYYDYWESKLNTFLFNNTFYLCPICIDVMEYNKKCSLLCNHHLCSNCIHSMIHNNMVFCPFCRNNIATNSPQRIDEELYYSEEDDIVENNNRRRHRHRNRNENMKIKLLIILLSMITFFCILLIFITSYI